MPRKKNVDHSEKKIGTLTRGEYVYRELLRWIREGEYTAGDRIRESEITSALNVSRTPVREAIRRLQSEGHLTFEPQKGVIVAELDRQEVAELYALREHLEGIAARFAAKYADEAEIEALEHILSQSSDYADDRRTLTKINWDLHHALYAASHNRFLIRVFTALSDSMALLRGEKFIPSDRPGEIFNEHVEILRAIRDRDPEAAEEAAKAHVRSAARVHLKSMSTATQSDMDHKD